MAAFMTFVCIGAMHGEERVDIYAKADQRLERAYRSSLERLNSLGQDTLRKAERAWITFTQKNWAALTALRNAGVLDESATKSITFEEQQQRSLQLERFFLGGRIEFQDTAEAWHGIDAELEATYRECRGRLSPAAQLVLRDAQRAWLVYRDADADACAFAARLTGRGSGRGFAAKAHLTRGRIDLLRTAYLGGHTPAARPQPLVNSSPTPSPHDQEIAEQLRNDARTVLQKFVAKKDEPFFGKPESIKQVPELPPDLVADLATLDSRYEQIATTSVGGDEGSRDEGLTLLLLGRWREFTDLLKNGNVGDAGNLLKDVLAAKPKGEGTHYGAIWQAAEKWVVIYEKEAPEFLARLKKAKTSEDLGKTAAAIREYQAAFEIIENSQVPKAVKRLREKALGL